MLNTYVSSKETIALYVNDILKLSTKYEVKTVSRDLETLKQRIIDDQFQLVVVGMFSRGKSTFIDALLGKRILPTSKKPTTAVISKVIYNSTPSFYLHYKDGRKPNPMSEKEFLNFTASNTEDDEIRSVELENISFAQVGYPLTFCQNGVVLVDTPGTNDLNQTRVELTYQYLNKADAVIMLLAADQALSIGEVEFLKERILKNQISDIFFIINRKDTLASPIEEQRVLEFVKQNVLNVTGDSLKGPLHLYLLSSYQALLARRKQNGESLSSKQLLKLPNELSDTGFPQFESDLAHFLEVDKGNVKLRRFVSILNRQLVQLKIILTNKKEIISHSTDNLDEIISELKESIARTKPLIHEVVEDIKVDFSQSKVLIMDKCKIASAKVPGRIKASIPSYSGSDSRKDIYEFINQHLETAKKEIIDDIATYQNILIKEGCNKAEIKIEGFFSVLNKKYKESFNLTSDLDMLTLGNSPSLLLEEEVSFEEGLSRTIYKALRRYYSNVKNNAFLRTAAMFVSIFVSTPVDSDIAQLVEDAYPKWSKRLEEHIVDQFESYTKRVIERVEDIANLQLDELVNQLEIVRLDKKKQESEKDKLLKELNKDMRALEQILKATENIY
ncbi:dynamin family protein [Veillonella sp.]|jgi:dynamin family protein|uniref:dynamin family protein n=1 Tax=Veillonella sp. TaxID=1926307 RepID=UPI00257CC0A7|nr:dynamin family protein [Veillonella sp.]MBS6121855.1 dynamin family protein [Veillonella sp.]